MVKLYEINNDNEKRTPLNIVIEETNTELVIKDKNTDYIFLRILYNPSLGKRIGFISFDDTMKLGRNVVLFTYNYSEEDLKTIENFIQQNINRLPEYIITQSHFGARRLTDFGYRIIDMIDAFERKPRVDLVYALNISLDSLDITYREFISIVYSLVLPHDYRHGTLETYEYGVLQLRNKNVDKTFFKHLANNVTLRQQKFIIPIVDKIIKNCKPYLKEIDYNVVNYRLYRGINSTEIFVEKVSRLEDRKPRDTHEYVHMILNDLFEDRFGWRARNGVFAVGDYHTAASYAKTVPHLFFPVGTYKYIWNPALSDFYYDIQYELDAHGTTHGSLTMSKISEIVFHVWSDYKNDFTNKNLIDAIRSKNEIAFNVERYYGVLTTIENIFIDLLQKRLNKYL